MKEQRVTPAQFSVIRATLVRLEALGYDPHTCSREALKRAGVPEPDEPVKIVVDEELT